MEILRHLLESREISGLRKEWEMNRKRVENIPELDDQVLDMLIERAEAIAGEESSNEISELARRIDGAEGEEEIDGAIAQLVARAERKKMALEVLRRAREEKKARR